MAQLEKQRQQRFVVQNTPAVALTTRIPPPPPPPPTLTKTIVNNVGPNGDDEQSGKSHEIVVTVNHEGRDVVTVDKLVPPPAKQTDTLIKRVLINNTVTQATVRAPVPQPQEEAKDTPSKTVEQVRQKSPSRVVGRKEDDPDLATLREALRRLPRIKEDDRHRVLKLAEARYENHR